jgi:glycosyltransferase involved in cell wall biosynthesis
MTPDVTVVVPTRNRQSRLAATLASVLGQRDVSVRVVVVDEASSDATPAYLAALGDARVTTVRHDSPRGVAAARNSGVARTQTRWVAFCDDDDLWAPDKLRAQLAALAGHDGSRWVACGSVLVDERLQVLDHQRAGQGGDVAGRLCLRNDIPGGGSGVLADGDLVREAGGFREDEPNSEDWDLWVRLAQRSPLAVIDRPLVAYRIWSGSMSRSADRMIAGYDRITTRYADVAREHGVVPDVVGHRTYLAKQLLRSGAGVPAARLYLHLARVHGARSAWLRVPLAALAPHTLTRIGDRRALARVPLQWRREAEGWLAGLDGGGRGRPLECDDCPSESAPG